MRTFDTGATRDSDAGKPDYEGFLSPLVIEAFGRYMLKHQTQADGSQRDSDNWQKGIPQPAYMKSGWRHFFDWWGFHRGMKLNGATTLEDAICALIFNAQGYLHEYLKQQSANPDLEGLLRDSLAQAKRNFNSGLKPSGEKFTPGCKVCDAQKVIWDQAKRNLRSNTQVEDRPFAPCSQCGHMRVDHGVTFPTASSYCRVCACKEFIDPGTNP